MNSPPVPAGAPVDLVPPAADKDARYRLGRFSAWLQATARPWYTPDLAAYRDHLLAHGRQDGGPLAPATVSAHLATVRARLRELQRDRDGFYRLVAPQTSDLLERKALVDELVTRLTLALDPAAAPVPQTVHQDRPDAAQRRLTAAQASALLAAPGLATPAGLRDTAVVALLLCTGLREAELCGLEVPDLRQRLGGTLALHVRRGKGRKERLIPYGDLDWCLAVVDKWQAAAHITSGPVLRGLYKTGQRLRPGRLSVRAVGYILAAYPISVAGVLVTVTPHDLRRTYAARLYAAGLDPVAIQQNLGHRNLKTTLGYIGPLDAAQRQPPGIYTFDLGRLAQVPVQALLDLDGSPTAAAAL
ncbi:MAG: site-specific integrase [Chloroflexi bacterium]|nr:site-specific integrase [Chloroflexota bacterium]